MFLFVLGNSGFSPELRGVLQTFKFPDCQADEQALWQQFDQPDQNRKWREGLIKSSFNYLLLDPRFFAFQYIKIIKYSYNNWIIL